MAKQSPFYRGIYTYVAANKPDGTTVKANPKYRGIYAYDATKKPSGTLLDTLAASSRATGSRTVEGEAVSTEVEPAPWDSMTAHSQIDAFVGRPENGITTPEGWSAKTIAQKKEWLDENG